MRVLDLFSGIGGFSLGLERAGMETVAFCEIEEFPRKVLNKHWPDVPIYEDVRKLSKSVLDEDGINDIGLICGGYPCQPFSVAGSRRGKEDDRHLWPEVLRLSKEIRPRYLVFENVAGHISMGLDEVLADLGIEGYTTSTFIIPAASVNAIHRRERVWILAHTNDMRELQQKRSVANKRRRTGNGSKNVTDADSKRLQRGQEQGSYGSFRAKPFDKYTGGRSKPFDGFQYIGWPTESALCGGNDGIPCGMDRGKRLKALGNAVVPQIPELIGRAIMSIENNSEA